MFPVSAKSIYGSFCRIKSTISNVVNCKINQEEFEMSKNDYNQNSQNDKQQDKTNNQNSQNSSKNSSKNSSGSNAQDNQKNNY